MELLYSCDREHSDVLGARCRLPALENGRCVEHPGADCPPAKRPTRILVKISVPANLLSEGLKALAQKNNRNFRASFSNQPQGKAQFTASAEARGLDPFYYRAGTPDEGTLALFVASGPDASPRSYQPPTVAMPFLLEQIYQHLGMASVQGWYPQSKKDAFLLQVEFSSKAAPGNVPDYYAEHEEEISRLLEFAYRTYIYENPDGPDKYGEGRYLLCTVNAGYRAEEVLEGVLHYTAGAMWEVK